MREDGTCRHGSWIQRAQTENGKVDRSCEVLSHEHVSLFQTCCISKRAFKHVDWLPLEFRNFVFVVCPSLFFFFAPVPPANTHGSDLSIRHPFFWGGLSLVSLPFLLRFTVVNLLFFRTFSCGFIFVPLRFCLQPPTPFFPSTLLSTISPSVTKIHPPQVSPDLLRCCTFFADLGLRPKPKVELEAMEESGIRKFFSEGVQVVLPSKTTRITGTQYVLLTRTNYNLCEGNFSVMARITTRIAGGQRCKKSCKA